MSDEQKLRAAEAVANREPDDECRHHWVVLGIHEDGTEVYRCTKCGEESD